MAQGDVFQGDPTTGEGTLYTSAGATISGNIADIWNSPWAIQNGTLVDTSNPFNRTPLGQAGPVLIQEVRSGVYGVSSSIDVAGVNRGASENWFRSISGTIDVQTPLGNTIQFAIDTSMVNHAGYQTVAQTDEFGNTRFSSLRGPYNSTREIQALVNPNLRLATPEETVANSIRYTLWTYQQDELRQLAREFNKLTSTGDPDVSGILKTLFQTPDLSNITAQTNYLYGP